MTNEKFSTYFGLLYIARNLSWSSFCFSLF